MSENDVTDSTAPGTEVIIRQSHTEPRNAATDAADIEMAIDSALESLLEKVTVKTPPALHISLNKQFLLMLLALS
jgi:hypothetical protein